MNTRIFVSVVALISCVQCVFGFGQTPLLSRPLVEYKENTPEGAVVVGSSVVSYYSYPYGNGLILEYVHEDAFVTEAGITNLDFHSESLWGIPTSDNKGRLDRESYDTITNEAASDFFVAGYLTLADLTNGPHFFSSFIETLSTNGREGLAWIYGDEWQHDEYGYLENYQGFYVEFTANPDWETCQESNVVDGNANPRGNFGTGNPITNPIGVNNECTWLVNYDDEDDPTATDISLTFTIKLGTGARLAVVDDEANVVALFDEHDNGIQTVVVTGDFAAVNYNSWENDTNEYGFSVIYDRLHSDGNNDHCTTTQGCEDPCVQYAVCTYASEYVNPELAPTYDWSTCCNPGGFTKECVVAADNAYWLNICYRDAAKRGAYDKTKSMPRFQKQINYRTQEEADNEEPEY